MLTFSNIWELQPQLRGRVRVKPVTLLWALSLTCSVFNDFKRLWNFNCWWLFNYPGENRDLQKHLLAGLMCRTVFTSLWSWAAFGLILDVEIRPQTQTCTHTCIERTAQIPTCCLDVSFPSPCYKLQWLAGCACWVGDKTMSEVCRRLLSTEQRGCYDCGVFACNIQAGLFVSPRDPEWQCGELSHM